jgi:hypothetical protein
MTPTTDSNLKPAANIPSKVKGPIRCHKCQLKCRDAEHYLSHKCEAASAPECAPYPTLPSLSRR